MYTSCRNCVLLGRRRPARRRVAKSRGLHKGPCTDRQAAQVPARSEAHAANERDAHHRTAVRMQAMVRVRARASIPLGS